MADSQQDEWLSQSAVVCAKKKLVYQLCTFSRQRDGVIKSLKKPVPSRFAATTSMINGCFMAYTCLVTLSISDYRPVVNLHLYGSHPLVFITKQATLILPNTTQVYFNSDGYPYRYAACFGLYLGHHQTRQQKKPLRIYCIFLFYGIHIDTPEHGLSMGRITQHTCKDDKLN